MTEPVDSAEPTHLDLMPPTASELVQRRLQRVGVLVTQAEVYGTHTLPLLRTARNHLAGTLDRLDEMIRQAEVNAEAASVPSTVVDPTLGDQLTTAARIDRID